MLNINFSPRSLRKFKRNLIYTFKLILFVLITLIGLSDDSYAQLKIGVFGTFDRSYVNKIDESGFSFSHYNAWTGGLALSIQTNEKLSVENKFSYTKIGIQFADDIVNHSNLHFGILSGFEYSPFERISFILQHNLNLAFYNSVNVGVTTGGVFNVVVIEERRLRLNLISFGTIIYPYRNLKFFD